MHIKDELCYGKKWGKKQAFQRHFYMKCRRIRFDFRALLRNNKQELFWILIKKTMKCAFGFMKKH